MNSRTLSELRATSGIFDRAAEMPRPRRKRPSGPRCELVIDQRATTAMVHPDLPATPAWTYDGLLPGPVVVVRAGDRIQMTHEHNIVGTLPYRVDPGDVEESDRAAVLHATARVRRRCTGITTTGCR